MNRNRTVLFAFILFLLSVLATSVSADDAVYDDSSFYVSGFQFPEYIYDGSRDTYSTVFGTGTVTVNRVGGIDSIYVLHDTPPAEWYITDPTDGKTVPCAVNGFLHEFIDIDELFGKSPETLVLTFTDGFSVCDIYAFSDGDLPDFVQKWESPLERADMMLVCSHSDDEHLYFAGLLPYYVGERELDVQVVYTVQHYELMGVTDHSRPHEQLDGLWAVGVRNYPVISNFPDLYTENEDPAEAFEQAKTAYGNYGITYDDFVSFIIHNLRRFKPLVVVSHDLDGEYGHGTHVMTAKAVCDAVRLSADASFDGESAMLYGGAWCVEKLYLHLYDENSVTLDLDTPLKAFDGKTAFEMSQHAFSLHETQQFPKFADWIYGTESQKITKASEISEYSPCKYGLYFTSIVQDTEGTDLFENVIPYADRQDDSGSNSVLDSMEAPATLHPETTEIEKATESVNAENTDTALEETKHSRGAIIVIVIISVMLCTLIGIAVLRSSKKSAIKRKRKNSASSKY